MKKKTVNQTVSVLLIGYYGFNNIGDEAMLDSIIKGFKKSCDKISLTVLSREPAETAKNYDVRAINRYGPLGIIKAIKKSNLVIFGGGNIFQNSTSSRSLIYYLTLIFLTNVIGRKLMLLGNGIGPINGNLLLKATASLLNKINIITLRDEISKNFLIDNKINKPLIKITADPVFSLLDNKKLKNSKNNIKEKKAAVSLRSCRGLKLGILAEYFDFLNTEFGYSITFFPMQPKKDLSVIFKVIKMMKTSATISVESLIHNEFPETLQCFDFIIGMRLHSLIFAAITGKPFLGIEYDPKVLSIIKDMGQESLGLPAEFEITCLLNKTRDFIENIELYKENVKNNLESKIVLSNENINIALSLMEGK